MVTLDASALADPAGSRSGQTVATYQLVTSDLVDPACPWRHDPARLGCAVLDLYRAR